MCLCDRGQQASMPGVTKMEHGMSSQVATSLMFLQRYHHKLYGTHGLACLSDTNESCSGVITSVNALP